MHEAVEMAEPKPRADARESVAVFPVVPWLAQEIYNQNRSRGIANAYAQARSRIQEAWQSENGRISTVSGKDLLSALSLWSQQNFNIGFGAAAIAYEIKRHELDTEIVQVLTAIENSRSLPNSSAAVQQRNAADGGGRSSLSSSRPLARHR
jgi:hypothetical protein